MSRAKDADILAFAKAVVEGEGYGVAYKIATGYVPSGENDNSRVLGRNLSKRADVAAAIAEYRQTAAADLQGLGLKKLRHYLEHEIDEIEPEKKGPILAKLATVLGINAPQKVEISKTVTYDARSVADFVASNPQLEHLRQLIGGAAGITVEGQPGVVEGTFAVEDSDGDK
ncbi:MAG: hypothetical protein ACK5NY_03430 [Burkholderiaceae bacterium]